MSTFKINSLKRAVYFTLILLTVYSCKKNSSDSQTSTASQEHIYFSSNGVKDTVVICCSPGNYFNYKDSAATVSEPISTYIYGLGNNGICSVGFSRTGIAVNSTQSLMYYSASGRAGVGGFMYYPTSSGVHITEYGGIGEYVSGNFTCNFVSPFDHNAYSVTCSFRIKRK